MKFAHMADMHFDTPFSSLNVKEGLGEKRRLEQRNAFRKAIDYILENDIEYLFISGDLYENEYVRKSTIDFIKDQFARIPDTKIVISPGNHDPYINGSYYSSYDFGKNVYVFSNSRIERIEDENVAIYGMAFTDFYMNESAFENFEIEDPGKLNILVAHCDLNGAKSGEGMGYNKVAESKLKSLKFDYCAIGHIHKNNLDNENRIFYPGSTISLGFDELGDHGMIVGEITKKKLDMDFVVLDDRKYVELEIIVSDLESKEELIEKIVGLDLNSSYLYKLVLVGNRNFEIDTRGLLKVLEADNILKIKDETKIAYNLEMIASQNNLRGMFVNEVIKMYNEGKYTKEECEKAIEIGLESM